MKKLFIAVMILVCTFLAAQMITEIARAYSWKHVLGGGLYGSVGTPLKVDADGALYVR